MTSEEIPEPDWEMLWQRSEDLLRRSEANQHRSTLGVRTAIAGLVLIGIVLGGVMAYAFVNRDVSARTEQSAQILQRLDAAEQQREALTAQQQADTKSTAKQNALAFAVFLENIAAAFATPPAPDAGRLQAVQGLCDAARSFREGVGDKNPPPCPAVP